MVEFISYNNEQIALLIKGDYIPQNTSFFTEKSMPQQVGFIVHKKGDRVFAHKHNFSEKKNSNFQEILIIRKGKLRLDLYTNKEEYIKSVVVNKGDVVILLQGGHGVNFLEDSEILEIKQGPYLDEEDKIFIKEIDSSKVITND